MNEVEFITIHQKDGTETKVSKDEFVSNVRGEFRCFLKVSEIDINEEYRLTGFSLAVLDRMVRDTPQTNNGG